MNARSRIQLGLLHASGNEEQNSKWFESISEKAPGRASSSSPGDREGSQTLRCLTVTENMNGEKTNYGNEKEQVFRQKRMTKRDRR